MTRLIKTLPILIPFLIYVGYLHLYRYYNYFSIDIKQWISPEEILLLSITDLITYIFHFFIFIFLGMYTLLTFEERFLKKDIPNKFLRWLTAVVKALIISLIFYSITFRLDNDLNSYVSNLSVSGPFFGIVLGLMLFRSPLEVFLKRTLSKFEILSFITIVTIAFHSVGHARKKYVAVTTSEMNTSISLSNHQVIDSLVYLGKTKEYYFLHHKNSRKNFIISKDKVDSISILFSGNNILQIID